ncbi:MAG: hypothetical protein LWW91_02085 [Bacteroidales bacterium]|jgi:hypothetical protein|nr:hypothetical protein [Bacteroidales bacterium]ODT56059.1 MAG: hypothetical protein ABS72_02155 [Paludibacter sp. SCN 50-10]OJX88508.1 MAG: hypothetical protein BGP01_09190 [Paludibacter sp. 47-17]
MVFKFTLLSDEVDQFVRVISIDSEATFLDLHNAILDSVSFQKNLMTTFFLCDDNWEKGQEVTLMEMESSSEYDNLVMEDTKLEELLSDEKQKLLYIFDMMAERAFFMELTEIVPGISMSKAECVSSKGQAPQQTTDEEDFMAASKLTIDENFYGDEDFDLDELDEEGFGDLNFDDGSLFNDDRF